MSRLKSEIYRRKLSDFMSRCNDEAFFQLVWAVDALQSGRETAAAGHLQYPPEASNNEIGSQWTIHTWELETLVSQLLVTPKMENARYIINCQSFYALSQAREYLRRLEDSDSGIYLKEIDIFTELHRIGHRQFPWQRGFFNKLHFYRFSYLYGGPECSAYFKGAHGLSLGDFSLIGFCIYAALDSAPAVTTASLKTALTEHGLSELLVDKGFELLCKSIGQLRKAAEEALSDPNITLLSRKFTAYSPSVMRRWPVTAFGAKGALLRAPIRDLIIQRITSGIYYDLIKGDSHLRNEISKRFESYCEDYFMAMLEGVSTKREELYFLASKRRPTATPDIRILKGGMVEIVVECKATKLTFNAQFSGDPVFEAATAYGEISKGIFQLWRYFSHVRQGLIGDIVSESATAMVLTLDSWLFMSPAITKKVRGDAEVLAASDGNITAEDRRKVLICSIEDLEGAFAQTNTEEFFRTLEASKEGRLFGWSLPNVRREIYGEQTRNRHFPFDLEDVLPWWKMIEKFSGPTGQSPSADPRRLDGMLGSGR